MSTWNRLTADARSWTIFLVVTAPQYKLPVAWLDTFYKVLKALASTSFFDVLGCVLRVTVEAAPVARVEVGSFGQVYAPGDCRLTS